MTPTVGDIVHFVTQWEVQPRAAIIIAVRDFDPVPEHGVPYCDLHVFPGLGGADQIKREVPFTSEPTANCWTWRG